MLQMVVNGDFWIIVEESFIDDYLYVYLYQFYCVFDLMFVLVFGKLVEGWKIVLVKEFWYY